MTEPRFPNVDWYCDRCGAHLNGQANFNDHKYVWKCTKCGFKNSISSDNIQVPNHVLVEKTLPIIDLLRTTCLHTVLLILLFPTDNIVNSLFGEYIVYVFAAYIILLIARLFAIVYAGYNVGYIAQLFGTVAEDIFLPYTEILRVGRNVGVIFLSKSIYRKLVSILYTVVCGAIIVIELLTVHSFCIKNWGSLLGTVDALKTWVGSIDNIRSLFFPFLLIVCTMQITTFLAFAIDKKYAMRQKWRVKESTLFLFCILFGAIGGVMGMKLFNHKKSKPAFKTLIPILAMIQAVLIIWFSIRYFA